MKITIDLDEDEISILKKRAKKNMFELSEQIEDIVRRGCINAKNTASSDDKCDDKLVSLFSRQNCGRKKVN